jgi:hypothetical protein
LTSIFFTTDEHSVAIFSNKSKYFIYEACEACDLTYLIILCGKEAAEKDNLIYYNSETICFSKLLIKQSKALLRYGFDNKI